MKKIRSAFIFCCCTLLTVAQNRAVFWGTTTIGGSGNGTIFKADSDGNLLLVDSLTNNEGKEPSGTLTYAANGKIYAVTRIGGAFDNGTLIECDPAANGTLTKKIDFNAAVSGANPEFSPVQATNGKLYGTTKTGGTENGGIIYEYDPVTAAFTKKFDFTYMDGKNPNGLIKATNNKLYGLTTSGGSANSGVLFEFDPATGIYTKKWELARSKQRYAQGYPDGNLIQASNGKLYGLGVIFPGATMKEMTLMLFEYDIPADTLTIKFANYAEELQQSNFFCGSLVEVPGGKLYGLKAYNAGIFEYDLATSSFDVKYKSQSGEASQGALTLASNGKLYGLSIGGINNKGSFFEYDYVTNTYTTKYNFDGPHGAFYLNVANNALLEECKSIPYQAIADTITTACEHAAVTIKTGIVSMNYTFQWYKDGKSISTGTSENLDFSSLNTADAGVYFCKISNGCSIIQTENVTVKVKDCSVGIDEADRNTLFRIYPNPANEQVTIQIKNDAVNKISIELIDLLGRSVYIDDAVQINSGNNVTLTISSIKKGGYLLKIRNLQTNNTGSEKLIIE